MQTLITRGIEVSVATEYWEPYSQADRNHFVFAYRITLRNASEEVVRLVRRCWKVTDGAGEVRTVEGPGVVGETPFLAPGEHYSYTSWCQLRSQVGSMEGYYTMQAAHGNETFPVFVPKFVLAAPAILN